MKRIIFGLGSNLGDREFFLDEAVRELGVQLLLTNPRKSKIFKNPAMLLPDSPHEWDCEFLNIAFSADIDLETRPESLSTDGQLQGSAPSLLSCAVSQTRMPLNLCQNTPPVRFSQSLVSGSSQRDSGRVLKKFSPERILEIVKAIEKKLGRQERMKWAPREIDIDILAIGDLKINLGDKLIIPHPGLFTREFFVKTVREIESKIFDF